MLFDVFAQFNISVSGFYPAGMQTDFFKKAGDKKSLEKYLEIGPVIDTLEFMVNLPEHVCIPELGIKKIGN